MWIPRSVLMASRSVCRTSMKNPFDATEGRLRFSRTARNTPVREEQPESLSKSQSLTENDENRIDMPNYAPPSQPVVPTLGTDNRLSYYPRRSRSIRRAPVHPSSNPNPNRPTPPRLKAGRTTLNNSLLIKPGSPLLSLLQWRSPCST